MPQANRVERRRNQVIAPYALHRDCRRWKSRVGEAADGDAEISRKVFVLPVDGGSACPTEMKGQRVAAFGEIVI
jgi:hypothetical protein